MELLFNADNFKKRLKTEFLDEKGNLYYWGIYDFSYKYRTRIYDKDNQEIYYVEKDIYDNNLVNLFDYKGNKVGEIIRKDAKEYPIWEQFCTQNFRSSSRKFGIM